MSSMEKLRVEVPSDGMSFMFQNVTISMISHVGTSGNNRLIDIWYLDNRELGQDLKPPIPYMFVPNNKSFPSFYAVIASTLIYGDQVVHLVKYVGV